MLRPGPSWGANSAPPDLLSGFCGEERKAGREGKGEEKGKGGKKWKGKGRRRTMSSWLSMVASINGVTLSPSLVLRSTSRGTAVTIASTTCSSRQSR